MKLKKALASVLIASTLITTPATATATPITQNTTQNASYQSVYTSCSTTYKYLVKNKKVKMKSKATKTFTKKTTERLEPTEKTTKGMFTETYKQNIMVDYTTTKYTKGSRYKVVTTKRRTDTYTEITPLEFQPTYLPETIQKKTGKLADAFHEMGFNVYLTLCEKESEFNPERQMIYLHKDDGKEIYKQLGYFWHFICSQLEDKTAEMERCHKAEKTKIKTIKNLKEADWASEVYKRYITSPKTLKKYCPKTYKWIDEGIRGLQQSQVKYIMGDYFDNLYYGE